MRADGSVDVLTHSDLLEATVDAVAKALVKPGPVGVIASEAVIEALRTALPAHDRVELVPAGLAKGLEFDHVILVEPADIVDAATGGAEPATSSIGLRHLCVALTRAVSHLTLIHTQPHSEPTRQRPGSLRQMTMHIELIRYGNCLDSLAAVRSESAAGPWTALAGLGVRSDRVISAVHEFEAHRARGAARPYSDVTVWLGPAPTPADCVIERRPDHSRRSRGSSLSSTRRARPWSRFPGSKEALYDGTALGGIEHLGPSRSHVCPTEAPQG